MARPLLAAATAVAAAVAGIDGAAAPETAIWGQAYGGDAGRSFQSGTLGPRFPGGSGTPSPAQPAGFGHVLDVVWRWQLPAIKGQDTSMFYYGGVDSAGDLYYLRTANGALAHYVYKVSCHAIEALLPTHCRLWLTHHHCCPPADEHVSGAPHIVCDTERLAADHHVCAGFRR